MKEEIGGTLHAYRRLLGHLLETDKAGDYFEPLIGPTDSVIVFDWAYYRLALYPDGTWTLVEDA